MIRQYRFRAAQILLRCARTLTYVRLCQRPLMAPQPGRSHTLEGYPW